MSQPPRTPRWGRRSRFGIPAALLTVLCLYGSRPADPIAEVPGPIDLETRIALESGRASADLRDRSIPETTGTLPFLLVGEIDPEAVRERGGIVGTRAGNVMTVIAPLDRLQDLAGVPGLERLSVARSVRPLSDVSVPETGASALWDGDGGSPPTYRGLTGRGVVIGIVDSGLDLGHADFCTPTGSTRVLYAWDQTWAGGPPAGFAYGTEYTRNVIDAGQAGAFRDNDGHGTHVAGIAAGDGSATGEGEPAYRYVGVAPQADLIVVKTNFTDAGIIDGVNYIFTRAAALGKPAVVNLSVGTHEGGHDGSHALDVALTALTGPGRLITAAAGNDGDQPVHAHIDLAPGATATVEFEVPDYTTSTIFPESIFLEGWHGADQAFRVRLTGPTGSTSGWVEPGTTSGSVATNEGTCRVENGITTNPRGAKEVSVAVWRSGSAGTHPAPGVWTLTVTPATGSSGPVDFWVTGWNLGSGSGPGFRNPDPDGTITSPATADGVIATGAYATKRQWTNGSGGFSSFGNLPLGALASFSSRGPRRDGVVRPDVVAPGYGVAAALSRTAPTSAWEQTPDRVHAVRAGTSQANAHTTGALALLLEDRRARGLSDLTPAEARQELILRAREDAQTGSALPDPGYGHGKLRLQENPAPVGAEPVAPERFAFRIPFPNPSRGTTTFQYTLSAADAGGASGSSELRIYDVQGGLVTVLPGGATAGTYQLVWDGTASGQRVPGGVYFAHLRVNGLVSLRKLVRLDP